MPVRVLAAIQLLSTTEGGRSSPIADGYRSLARFAGRETDFGFELKLDASTLEPGQGAVAQLSFWAGEELLELAVGSRFELREGARVVGHGTILRSQF